MTRDQINEKVQIRIDEVQSGSSQPISNNVVEAIYSVIDSELDNAAFDVIRFSPLEVLYPIVETDKKFHHGQGVEDVDVRLLLNSDYSGQVVLPANFHRFVSLKLSDWTIEVTELHKLGSEVYNWQKNKYTKGRYDQPIGIYTPFSAYVTAEREPFDIAHIFASNVTLSSLYNGQTVDTYTISTGDILELTGQADEDQNGVYSAKASGAPTYLTSTSIPTLPKACIRFYSSKSSNATIEQLNYIPKKKAEEMPDELLDPLEYICAARVFQILQLYDLAKTSVDIGMGILMTQNKGIV
jgi:hypothetical protein